MKKICLRRLVILESCWSAVTVHRWINWQTAPVCSSSSWMIGRCGFECSVVQLDLFHTNSWHWIFLNSELFCPSFHTGMGGGGHAIIIIAVISLLSWARSLAVKVSCSLVPLVKSRIGEQGTELKHLASPSSISAIRRRQTTKPRLTELGKLLVRSPRSLTAWRQRAELPFPD